MAIDMAALKVSGVAGTTLLIPLPLVIHKKGATPPMVRSDAPCEPHTEP